jgi:hypothetical protein
MWDMTINRCGRRTVCNNSLKKKKYKNPMKIGRTNTSVITTVKNHNQVGHTDTIPAYYGHTPKMKEHLDIALVYQGQLLVIFGNKECPHLQATILKKIGTNS